MQTPVQASPCPDAALSQVRIHRTDVGESMGAVASQYGLLPATLVAMNPTIPAQGILPVGQAVAVPPFNGTVVQVSDGQTWQSLAERHGTRADVLFEVNGCPSQLPRQVFIPGGNARIVAVTPVSLEYPLPSPASVVLSYGWQPHPQREELVFNSGIALAASPGTEVRASANGTVAFVGDHNGAVMVVINHSDGLQTRYGNLTTVQLAVGDPIQKSKILGTVAGDLQNSFVYFEVRTNSSEGWIARDPGQYLSELELQQ
ncbi:MAG: M23 family metallopeptidase [Cyanobacteria bacterium J06642_11]